MIELDADQQGGDENGNGGGDGAGGVLGLLLGLNVMLAEVWPEEADNIHPGGRLAFETDRRRLGSFL